MKVNFQVKLVAEFDEAIPSTRFDEFLRSKLSGKGLDLAFPYGGNEYVLIVKDIISDK